MKNSTITNRQVGSGFGYNDWVSPDAISYSRLQGIPKILPDRLHEVHILGVHLRIASLNLTLTQNLVM